MITHNRSIAQTADRVLQVSDGNLTDLGGAGNEKLFKPCADLCKGAETAESDDHSVCHYFDISGDSNFSVADMMIRTQSDRMTGKTEVGT